MTNNEQILSDLLSGDAKRILDASHKVISCGITNKRFLQDLYLNLHEIEDKTRNIHYGGGILPNKRFVEKAIRMIRASITEECLCEHLFEKYGQSGKSLERYGFILTEEKTEGYVTRSIIQCSACNQHYEVQEKFTGGHVTTTEYRKVQGLCF